MTVVINPGGGGGAGIGPGDNVSWTGTHTFATNPAFPMLTNLPKTAQKTTSYTAQLADAGTVIWMGAAGNLTLTIPTGVFAVGDFFYVLRAGAGGVTLAITGPDVFATGSPNPVISDQTGIAMCWLWKANTWIISGDLG